MVDMDINDNFKILKSEEPSGRLNKAVWSWIVGIVTLVVGFFFPPLWIITILSVINIAMTYTVQGISGRQAQSNAARKEKFLRLYAMTAVNQNGQLVSTRKSNDPVRICYGIVRSAGVWVYFKMSRANNQALNTVVSWCEGEIEGLATAIDFTPIYPGSGINDLHTGGQFVYAACSCDNACYNFSACSCNMTCDSYS
jgi:hypothetical protein